MKNLSKFETGNIYCTNHSLHSTSWKCVKRTAKTVTFERFKNPCESITKCIKTYKDFEYIIEGWVNDDNCLIVQANNIIG